MIGAIGNIFGWIMYGCVKIVKDYGWTIVVFTLLTKIIMLPISIMVQKNSIKMVKMYPEMNRIKAKYYGYADQVLEEIKEFLRNIIKNSKYECFLVLIDDKIKMVWLSLNPS